MLESPTMRVNGKLVAFFTEVRDTEDLLGAIDFWTAHVARDILRLGVYLRAAAIMAQLPGAARYRTILHDDAHKSAPPEADDPRNRLKHAGRDTTLDVLAECLDRLGAAGVLLQMPCGQDHEREELPAEWIEYIDRYAQLEHGLLNLVAQCLDQLIVRPGMAEIDVARTATWWQRWWAEME